MDSPICPTCNYPFDGCDCLRPSGDWFLCVLAGADTRTEAEFAESVIAAAKRANEELANATKRLWYDTRPAAWLIVHAKVRPRAAPEEWLKEIAHKMYGYVPNPRQALWFMCEIILADDHGRSIGFELLPDGQLRPSEPGEFWGEGVCERLEGSVKPRRWIITDD